jgi:MFS family permease
MSAGGISDKYGRMGTQLFNTVPFILGGLILTFSIDVWSMALGRFLSGIGCGIAAVFVPLYIQEVTSPSLQGIM